MRLNARLCIVLLLSGACGALGTVHDGTTVSRGFHNNGRLLRGVRLPPRGDGYLVPPTWAQRGLSYGTDELVTLIVRAARRVAEEMPGSKLYVADLSPVGGGPSTWHRSHQTGRDADLLYFGIDENGRPPSVPSAMAAFSREGISEVPGKRGGRPRKIFFDTPRNWALVRTLIGDPLVDVQYLFIFEPLKRRLLEHAVAIGEPAELIARATAILHQPSDSLPHDDHLHVRIYCPLGDRAFGCVDWGPLRWFKKTYKYWMLRRWVWDGVRYVQGFIFRPFCGAMTKTMLAAL